MSDTHEDMAAMRHALGLLQTLGAGHFIHCGDIGRRCLARLSQFCVENGAAAHVAIGNSDGFLVDSRYSPTLPGITLGSFLSFALDGKTCAVLHGDIKRQLTAALECGDYDYVFSGHTHRPLDERIGKTRHINPGAVTGPRNSAASVALLDLATDELQFILLD